METSMNLEPELKIRPSRRKLAALADARIGGTKTGRRAERDLGKRPRFSIRRRVGSRRRVIS